MQDQPSENVNQKKYSLTWANRVAHQLEQLRYKRPLIYTITDFVTANDLANSLLALGASPVMAQAPEELPEIVKSSHALLVNLGMVTVERLALMDKTLSLAKDYGKPAVLDPAGTGSASFRTAAARQLLQSKAIKLIRLNVGEAAALSETAPSAHANGGDRPETSSNLPKQSQPQPEVASVAHFLSKKYSGKTIAVTGKQNWIANSGTASIAVDNGIAMLQQVSGSGEIVSGLCAAFCTVAEPREAAIAALTVFGIAAELAAQEAKGPATLRIHLIDALANLTSADVIKLARIIDESEMSQPLRL